MLRSFRVANHKSIRDEQELVLLPVYEKDRATVPVAGIWGANAAGKTNIIDALAFMAAAVRSSYQTWEPGSGVPRSPFRLDPSTADEPSLYVVDVVLDDERYVYGFAVDDEKFVEEWLYHYPVGQRRTIFERTGGTVKFGSMQPEYRRRSTFLTETTRENSSVLGTAALANEQEVGPIYEWFRSRLAFRRPSGRLGLSPRMGRELLQGPDRQSFVDLVRAADLGITDLRLLEVPIEDPLAPFRVREAALRRLLKDAQHALQSQPGGSETPAEGVDEVPEARVRNELVFLHGETGVPFTAREESDGTISWLNLLSSAITVLRRGTVLCVDEIDSSLHPRLTKRLIELYQHDDTNPRAAQLIFTTHDASLLGTALGGRALKRDQIWFVDKGADGATNLFPLTDFYPRNDENTERRYLGGSYGAVPVTLDEDFRQALQLGAEQGS